MARDEDNQCPFVRSFHDFLTSGHDLTESGVPTVVIAVIWSAADRIHCLRLVVGDHAPSVVFGEFGPKQRALLLHDYCSSCYKDGEDGKAFRFLYIRGPGEYQHQGNGD
jgi:hypothetical protein